MGCTSEQQDCGDDEKPAHDVTLSDFYIGKYEVTQQQWVNIMGSNPSHFNKCDQCPVERVSWGDVQVFLKKLNTKFPGKNYRLPTEAEWEFAAQGGTSYKGYEYSGSQDLNEVGWFSENSGDKRLSGGSKSELLTQNNCKTRPVGQKKANELDLFDMSGNVWEWCADWYGTYPSEAQANPTGPASGSNRILRGGSYYDFPQDCRMAVRNSDTPDAGGSDTGFRVVRTK